MHVAVTEAAPIDGTRAAQPKPIRRQRERNAESLASANRSLHRLTVAGGVAGDVDLGDRLLLQRVFELVPAAEHRSGKAALFGVVLPAEVREHVTALVRISQVFAGHSPEGARADD